MVFPFFQLSLPNSPVFEVSHAEPELHAELTLALVSSMIRSSDLPSTGCSPIPLYQM